LLIPKKLVSSVPSESQGELQWHAAVVAYYAKDLLTLNFLTQQPLSAGPS
jgi:hypothetical protein